MQRHKRRGMGDRSFQAGKGSADRSPKWRDGYADIAWPDGGQRLATDGFVRNGNRIIKRYGGAAGVIKEAIAPAGVIH